MLRGRVNEMNQRDLRRIEAEHESIKKILVSPLCPKCGTRTIASTIEQYCDFLDGWGDVCGGREEQVPVWKCRNGHISHIVIME